MSRPFKGTNLEWCQRHAFHGMKERATRHLLLGDRSITSLCEECAALLESGSIQEERGKLRLILSQDTHHEQEAT